VAILQGGIYMLIRRLVVTALMRVAQNPAVQKKAGEGINPQSRQKNIGRSLSTALPR